MATALDPTATVADAGPPSAATPPSFPPSSAATAAAPPQSDVASAAEAAAAAEHAAASTRLTHSILSAAEAAVLLPSSSPGAAGAAAAGVAGGGSASGVRPAGASPSGAAAAIAPSPAGGRVGTMPRNATRRGIKYRCGTCGQRGHNAKTCTGSKDGSGVKAPAGTGVEAVVAGRVVSGGSPAAGPAGVAGAPVEGATFLGDDAEELVEAGSAMPEPSAPSWQPVPSGVVVVGTPTPAAPSPAGSSGAGAAAGGATTPPASSADDAGHPLFSRALAVAKKRVVAAEATVFALRSAPLSDFSTAATQLASAVSALETVLACARRCSTALGEEGSSGGLLTDGPPAKRARV
ncbi:hypothetical protein MMPV_005009 [Pyropia vietnamensis]